MLSLYTWSIYNCHCFKATLIPIDSISHISIHIYSVHSVVILIHEINGLLKKIQLFVELSQLSFNVLDHVASISCWSEIFVHFEWISLLKNAFIWISQISLKISFLLFSFIFFVCPSPMSITRILFPHLSHPLSHSSSQQNLLHSRWITFQTIHTSSSNTRKFVPYVLVLRSITHFPPVFDPFMFIKRTYQPSVLIRKRRHGFLARSQSSMFLLPPHEFFSWSHCFLCTISHI